MKEKLTSKYLELETKVNALSSRERFIMTGVLVFLFVGVVDWLLLQPNVKERKKIESGLTSLRNEMSALSQRIEELDMALKNDPNVILSDSIRSLNEKINKVDKQIEQETGGMISPEKMPYVLGELLSEKSGLSVQRIETRAAVNILGENAETKQDDPAIYQHGMELKLKGSFFQVMHYLESIERYPVKLIWNELDYKIDQHPKGLLVLRVSTLSLQEELIRVVQ